MTFFKSGIDIAPFPGTEWNFIVSINFTNYSHSASSIDGGFWKGPPNVGTVFDMCESIICCLDFFASETILTIVFKPGSEWIPCENTSLGLVLINSILSEYLLNHGLFLFIVNITIPIRPGQWYTFYIISSPLLPHVSRMQLSKLFTWLAAESESLWQE